MLKKQPTNYPIKFFFIAGLTLSCTTNAEQHTIDKLENTLPQEGYITEVQLATAEEKPFIYKIATNGTMGSEYETDVYWGTSGIVKDLRVMNGERVKKGEVLAILENRQEAIQLEKAKVSLQAAKIDYESERMGSQNSADSVRSRNIYINSGLAAAEIAYKEAVLLFEKTIVKAPISGVVANIEVSNGNLIKTGDVLCRMWDPQHLELNGKVMETTLAQLQVGLKASVEPIGSGRTYVGKLSGINPLVDEHGLVQISISLGDTKGLVPGQSARATIMIPYQQNIIVPKEAVVMRSGKAVVFTFEGGHAKWKYVTTGMENGDEVEVLEGLKAGDQVIVTNNLQLAHDASVKRKGEVLE